MLPSLAQGEPIAGAKVPLSNSVKKAKNLVLMAAIQSVKKVTQVQASFALKTVPVNSRTLPITA